MLLIHLTGGKVLRASSVRTVSAAEPDNVVCVGMLAAAPADATGDVVIFRADSLLLVTEQVMPFPPPPVVIPGDQPGEMWRSLPRFDATEARVFSGEPLSREEVAELYRKAHATNPNHHAVETPVA